MKSNDLVKGKKSKHFGHWFTVEKYIHNMQIIVTAVIRGC